MVKKFNIPCNFDGQAIMTDFYIGKPKDGEHPIKFQSNFLTNTKGGTVPQEVMDSIMKINKIADKHNVLFEDLFIYTMNIANEEKQEENKIFNKLLLESDSK